MLYVCDMIFLAISIHFNMQKSVVLTLIKSIKWPEKEGQFVLCSYFHKYTDKMIEYPLFCTVF